MCNLFRIMVECVGLSVMLQRAIIFFIYAKLKTGTCRLNVNSNVMYIFF
jgi:hypothetical protein